MLTMHKDKEYLYLALSAGAKGYLLKEDADRDLFSAIQRIRQEKRMYLPTSLRSCLMIWCRSAKEKENPSLKSTL